jgi:hypothetical protein
MRVVAAVTAGLAIGGLVWLYLSMEVEQWHDRRVAERKARLWSDHHAAAEEKVRTKAAVEDVMEDPIR